MKHFNRYYGDLAVTNEKKYLSWLCFLPTTAAGSGKSGTL